VPRGGLALDVVEHVDGEGDGGAVLRRQHLGDCIGLGQQQRLGDLGGGGGGHGLGFRAQHGRRVGLGHGGGFSQLQI